MIQRSHGVSSQDTDPYSKEARYEDEYVQPGSDSPPAINGDIHPQHHLHHYNHQYN